jgi:hypothetical protein
VGKQLLLISKYSVMLNIRAREKGDTRLDDLAEKGGEINEIVK